jgi:hypothetical protein
MPDAATTPYRTQEVAYYLVYTPRWTVRWRKWCGLLGPVGPLRRCSSWSRVRWVWATTKLAVAGLLPSYNPGLVVLALLAVEKSADSWSDSCGPQVMCQKEC